MPRTAKRSRAVVPAWARDAIWYQIFPERFRNGVPASNPQQEDCLDQPIKGWSISPWGQDWYRQEPWESARGDFFKSVYCRRFGGDLVGLRSKLDYLQDLGVNAIYLNPVFMAPSLHKYDAACLHHVDPTLGPDRADDLDLLARAGETEHPGSWIWTSADRCLVELVADVHRRGMHIILDGVFNHVGTRFFAFKDLKQRGRKSKYADWFRVTKWRRDGSFDYEGWFGHKGLPELARDAKTLAEPVRRYIFDITKRWMDPDGDGDPSDGVDGWRLDVAFCVPHGFWKAWRRWVKGINPDAFLTGEIVDLASDFLKGDEFDSVMNYTWLFPSVRFFSRGPSPSTASELWKELGRMIEAYPSDVQYVLQNLLDSHDVGRIATVLENELPLKSEWQCYFDLTRTQANPKLATTRPRPETVDVLKQMVIFQMTYLGAPMIYYGTEVGLWGANDPDNRQPMLWEDVRHEPEARGLNGPCRKSPREPDMKLFDFFRKAMALRHEHRALRRGKLQPLDSGSDRVLAFARGSGRERIIVALNASDQPAAFTLAGRGRDLWRGGRVVSKGRKTLPPRGWLVIKVEG